MVKVALVAALLRTGQALLLLLRQVTGMRWMITGVIVGALLTVGVAQMSVAYRIYTAQEGERPADIAKRFRIPLTALLQANPNLVADQKMAQGEVILVPAGQPTPSPEKPNQTQKIVPSSNIPTARAFWIWTVQPGETLSSIAQRFHVPLKVLAQANNITPTTVVVPGQVLMVPIFEQPVVSSEPDVSPSSRTRDRPTESRGALLRTSAKPTSIHRPPVLPAPRIFGYVGTVIASVASIHSLPRSSAPIWNRCAQGTQLLITDEHSDWWGVLMINGATGWVRKKALRKENRTILWDDILKALGGYGSGKDNKDVVNEAMRYLGVPYRYGGSSTVRGMDCSSFIQRVFASRGIRLPRTSAEQAQVGLPVSTSDLRPGDRLYFATKGNRINHCGIYIGNGLFVHASRRHNAVVLSSLSEPPYVRSLVAIRR